MLSEYYDVLFIGDIVGKPGRHAVDIFLPEIRKEYNVDFVIANAENAAGGFGCTRAIYDELLSFGVDLLTSGNHIFDQKEFAHDIDNLPRLIRPLNYPPDCPGKGYSVIKKNGIALAVLNVMGRVFTSTVDCPFRTTKAIVDKLRQDGQDHILLDVHAETTSEKQALGYFLASDVSAVLGTHTHVPTADECLLDERCAYISDVGMTGAAGGVLGFDKDPVIERFLTQRNIRFSMPKKIRHQLQAVHITINKSTGRAESIRRLSKLES